MAAMMNMLLTTGDLPFSVRTYDNSMVVAIVAVTQNARTTNHRNFCSANLEDQRFVPESVWFPSDTAQP